MIDKRLMSVLGKMNADLLEMASEVFSNHGCNDLPRGFFNGWNDEQKEIFLKDFTKWMDDPDYDCDDVKYITDYMLMYYLSDKLRGK